MWNASSHSRSLLLLMVMAMMQQEGRALEKKRRCSSPVLSYLLQLRTTHRLNSSLNLQASLVQPGVPALG